MHVMPVIQDWDGAVAHIMHVPFCQRSLPVLSVPSSYFLVLQIRVWTMHGLVKDFLTRNPLRS